MTDAQKIAIVAEAINATVRLERTQSAAGYDRQLKRYDRGVRALITLVLGREPTKDEATAVFE